MTSGSLQLIEKLLESLPDPTGLYVLNAEGELWFYDTNHQYCLDADLSNALAAQIRDFLTFYRKHPDACRLATVFPNREPKPWLGVTLMLEEGVVRNLYPAGRSDAKALTVFQRKNREKSVYRGMELLLQHRKSNASDTPVYVPVLFDCAHAGGGTLLASGKLDTENSASAFTAEVLDLGAAVPVGKRSSIAWQTLHQKLYGNLIREEQRLGTNFDVIKNFVWSDVFEKELDQLHVTDRLDLVERWLVKPVRPVDPNQLCKFVHFRDLDPEILGLVAAKCLIYSAPAGTRLFDAGRRDSWNFYLLNGTATLARDGQAMTHVTGGTSVSMSPIAFLKPRLYTVTSLTKVDFIWVHDHLLRVIAKCVRHPPPPVASVPDATVDVTA